MTVAMVLLSPLTVVAGPWGVAPGRIEVSGVRVDSPPAGWSDGTLMMCDVSYSGNQPTEYHTLNSENLSRNTSTLTITRTWSAPTLAVAKALLKARLDTLASTRWVDVRGVNAAGIESALATGKTNIDNAGTIASAIAAFQAVSFP